MLPIIYEDNDVWVIDKPSGIPSVHLVDSDQLSVTDLLLNEHPEMAAIGSPQDGGVVHRLDNNTSGCLIVAKTQSAYDHLRNQFDQSQIMKRYTAIVIGHPTDMGHTDVSIDHMQRRSTRMRCVDSGGQTARTQWAVIQRYPISALGGAGYSLLELQITTGVRHQIRVHLSHLGHPIVGDILYQSRQMRNCDRLGLPHHLLHASHISFLCPSSGKRITCSAPLPMLFTNTLKRLDETVKHR